MEHKDQDYMRKLIMIYRIGGRQSILLGEHIHGGLSRVPEVYICVKLSPSLIALIACCVCLTDALLLSVCDISNIYKLQ